MGFCHVSALAICGKGRRKAAQCIPRDVMWDGYYY